MKKIDIALLIGLAAAIVLTNFTAFSKTYDALRGDVLRLHILANSDSEEDQALKLKVRDEILKESAEFFPENATLPQTKAAVQAHLGEIQTLAEKTVQESGYAYRVECALVNMEFDERVYEDFTMPAGKYDALRVTIGEANGHNWWCVMYPPLCLPAAEKEENLKDYFTKDEIAMLKQPQRFKVEFKCVELFEKLKKWLDKDKDND